MTRALAERLETSVVEFDPTPRAKAIRELQRLRPRILITDVPDPNSKEDEEAIIRKLHRASPRREFSF